MTIRQFSDKYGISYYTVYRASKDVQPIANFWHDRDYLESELLASIKKQLKHTIETHQQKVDETKRIYSNVCWRATR